MRYFPGSWLFILSSVILISLFILSMDKWRLPVGKAFFFLIFSALMWNVMYMFEMASPTLELKLFYARIQFLAISFLPVGWFYLSLVYTTRKIRKVSWLFLLLIPVVINCIIWLAPMPNLFWGSPKLVPVGPSFDAVDYDYQFLFTYILMPYTYIMISSALIIMGRALGKNHRVYQNQTLLLMLGTLLPAIVNIFYILGITPLPHVNMSTAMFSITGVIFAWSLFKYRFLDLTPIARDMIIENMADGLLVLDSQQRIVDFNMSASSILSISADFLGKKVQNLRNREFGEKIASFLNENGAFTKVDLFHINKQSFDVHIKVMQGLLGFDDGYIVTLHNVTERETLYHKVKELAIRDSLTGVYNRGAFFEKGALLCKRSLEMENSSIAVIMLDVDHFKNVNDSHGHETGDNVLALVAKTCIRLTRTDDIVGRVGGDEFVILLPDTSLQHALAVARSIHQTVRDQIVRVNGTTITLTVSLGVAVNDSIEGPSDDHGLGRLISNADRALYIAKNQGRDRVAGYGASTT